MGEQKKRKPSCAACDLDLMSRACVFDTGQGSKGCPTLTRADILDEANKEYDDPVIGEFARQASIQEGECYANRDQQPYVLQPTKTRLIELIEFAKKMNYQRLGLAFCIGLVREADVVNTILEGHGFEVVSVLCKAGRTSKDKIGLTEEQKIYRGMDEPMCNPIYQAKLFNHERTDFNILLGLCVGHDSLFFKFAERPTTVLAVKDRVTGHNPLAAVYLSESYYQKLRFP
ncbi:MAG: DUF1847 domain-containing protein [Candidatus Abyssobacteria bacterium SURF_5]|uniref:DUF1847 domain-containing protein n=1 Tax=Abyssobacteria bacterium (strain SURF_5) TaxID=2093360 RepID=A0A3A4N7A9_ABYX5|nr:MAG: DUF1847 domain-containing protein [Candidatus Abyssubacteria bacterium SURF_5]